MPHEATERFEKHLERISQGVAEGLDAGALVALMKEGDPIWAEMPEEDRAEVLFRERVNGRKASESRPRSKDPDSLNAHFNNIMGQMHRCDYVRHLAGEDDMMNQEHESLMKAIRSGGNGPKTSKSVT